MKKLISLVLSVSMLLSFCFMAFAASPYTGRNDEDGWHAGDARVDSELQVQSLDAESTDLGTDFYIIDTQNSVASYQLCVKVPMRVAIAVARDGSASVPSNYRIENHSTFGVTVSTMKVDLHSGAAWTLVDTPAGEKQVKVSINSQDCFACSSAAQNVGWTIGGATGANPATLALPLAASAFPYEGTEETGCLSFTVIYTIAKTA